LVRLGARVALLLYRHQGGERYLEPRRTQPPLGCLGLSRSGITASRFGETRAAILGDCIPDCPV
jgi:hypothetical protein